MLESKDPRWRRDEVLLVRQPAQSVPEPRRCALPYCGKRLSQLNTSTLCFQHQPVEMVYVIPRGQNRRSDRA